MGFGRKENSFRGKETSNLSFLLIRYKRNCYVRICLHLGRKIEYFIECYCLVLTVSKGISHQVLGYLLKDDTQKSENLERLLFLRENIILQNDTLMW